jgi:hypothetical protein
MGWRQQPCMHRASAQFTLKVGIFSGRANQQTQFA